MSPDRSRSSIDQVRYAKPISRIDSAIKGIVSGLTPDDWATPARPTHGDTAVQHNRDQKPWPSDRGSKLYGLAARNRVRSHARIFFVASVFPQKSEVFEFSDEHTNQQSEKDRENRRYRAAAMDVEARKA
jgi:hypothetical protein